MKRLVKCVGFVVLLSFAAPCAFAQGALGIPLGQERDKTPDEIERAKTVDDAYKKSLKTIPDAKASNDPWGAIRTDQKRPPPPYELKKKKPGSTAAN